MPPDSADKPFARWSDPELAGITAAKATQPIRAMRDQCEVDDIARGGGDRSTNRRATTSCASRVSVARVRGTTSAERPA